MECLKKSHRLRKRIMTLLAPKIRSFAPRTVTQHLSIQQPLTRRCCRLRRNWLVISLLSVLQVSFSTQAPADNVDTNLQKSVTFNGDIAPIIFDKCTSCHRRGQSGPFSLQTYQDVSKRARTIQAVIDSGYMPPWKPVNHDVQFANDRRLSVEQKEKIKHWIVSGKPEGDGKPPTLPTFPEEWQLGKPDIVLKMAGRFEVPASGPDIYRSFVFPAQFPEDKWVKAIEYRPTATSSVHHAIFFIDQSGGARQLDGSDGKPGIPGMGFLGTSFTKPDNALSSDRSKKRTGFRDVFARIQQLGSKSLSPQFANELNRGLGGYVPGSTPAKLPGDLAMRLPAESDIVLQTHFHPSGRVESEAGKIGIYLADRPPSKQLVPIQVPAVFGVGTGLRVPAGAKDYTIKDSFVVPVDIQLVSIGAHAHYICRNVKMIAREPNGTSRTLLQIDDWDLDWQDRYYFREPITLPAGTVLESQLVYDNSADNPENPYHPPREIRWGRESNDEMASVTLLTVAVDQAKHSILTEGIRTYTISSISQQDIVDLLLQFDANQDDFLQRSETPARLLGRFHLLDRNSDNALSREELGVLRQFLPAGKRRRK